METTRKPRKLPSRSETKTSFPVEELTDIDGPRIIGLDLSITSPGHCRLMNAGLSYLLGHEKSVAQLDKIARWITLRDKLLAELDPRPTDWYFVEGYSYGSNAGRIADMAEFAGSLKVALVDMGVDSKHIWHVTPTQLKKFVTGKGARVDKNIIIKEIYRKWDVDINNDDEADAYALAKIGFSCVYGKNGLLSYESEVVDEVILFNTEGPKKKRKKAKK